MSAGYFNVPLKPGAGRGSAFGEYEIALIDGSGAQLWRRTVVLGAQGARLAKGETQWRIIGGHSPGARAGTLRSMFRGSEPLVSGSLSYGLGGGVTVDGGLLVSDKRKAAGFLISAPLSNWSSVSSGVNLTRSELGTATKTFSALSASYGSYSGAWSGATETCPQSPNPAIHYGKCWNQRPLFWRANFRIRPADHYKLGIPLPWFQESN
ncbi:fimbria/pilus outer membrane usher protein [Piscinibacter aquaticus]|uniref:Fimbria/pilus outer membrane usher protein n=1 Tax=Piscinibacter aquaticus TaxID=392597 RepID=A0A5C6TPD6_9BURK|nr:fimbria/pilus outer membrane usher protein [Piscinibacter aquaticus]